MIGSVRQVLRFVVVGGTNTVVTLVAWVLLSKIMDIRVAYTIVFVAGLAFTTYASARFVFRARATWSTSFRFLAWYVMVYLAGLGVVHLLESQTRLPDTAAAFVTLCCTAPLSFLGGRFIFSGTEQAQTSAAGPATYEQCAHTGDVDTA